MFSFFKKKIGEFLKSIKEKVEKKIKEEVKKVKKKIEYTKIKEDDINEILNKLEEDLINSDCSYSTTQKIIEDLKKNLIGKEVKKKEVENFIKQKIRESLEEIFNFKNDFFERIEKLEKPVTILFFGFNGSGKTTTIAKLAYILKKKYKVLLVAADTFRAGSIEQLKEHAKKLNVDIFEKGYGADPASVVYQAKKLDYDIILVDTAGRSHTNKNLMEELRKIVRVNNPDIKILVLDSLTGSDVINQFKFFNEVAPIDYVIFTKVDVNEKGGNILSIAYEFKVPIAFLGIGQNYEDLEEFNKEKIVKNFIG